MEEMETNINGTTTFDITSLRITTFSRTILIMMKFSITVNKTLHSAFWKSVAMLSVMYA